MLYQEMMPILISLGKKLFQLFALNLPQAKEVLLCLCGIAQLNLNKCWYSF
jgi:hypothetical protein